MFFSIGIRHQLVLFWVMLERKCRKPGKEKSRRLLELICKDLLLYVHSHFLARFP
jgi:hypothetical protein